MPTLILHMLLDLPTSTFFPYTTLFRSDLEREKLRPHCREVDSVLPHRGQHDRMDPISRLGSRGDGAGERGIRQMVEERRGQDRKSTRLNSSHLGISYAVFCLKKKIKHV